MRGKNKIKKAYICMIASIVIAGCSQITAGLFQSNETTTTPNTTSDYSLKDIEAFAAVKSYECPDYSVKYESGELSITNKSNSIFDDVYMEVAKRMSLEQNSWRYVLTYHETVLAGNTVKTDIENDNAFGLFRVIIWNANNKNAGYDPTLFWANPNIPLSSKFGYL
jgi:hypothetical protein